MKSSQHISNTFLNNQQASSPNEDETSTYSFRHVTKKLQHAKSYGQLYQPQTPLPLPTITADPDDEQNYDVGYRQKSPSNKSSQSKSRHRASSTTAIPALARQTMISANEKYDPPTQKIPLWKRFKRIIISTKKTKDRPKLSPYTLAPQSNEISTLVTSMYILTKNDLFFSRSNSARYYYGQ